MTFLILSLGMVLLVIVFCVVGFLSTGATRKKTFKFVKILIHSSFYPFLQRRSSATGRTHLVRHLYVHRLPGTTALVGDTNDNHWRLHHLYAFCKHLSQQPHSHQ